LIIFIELLLDSTGELLCPFPAHMKPVKGDPTIRSLARPEPSRVIV